MATPHDAAAIAAVHVTSWQETYTGHIPVAMLTALSVADRTTRWSRILADASDPRGTSVHVAELDGEVVGFASGGPQRDRDLVSRGFACEIAAIYLLRRAQGAGIGRRLMAAISQSLLDRGYRGASLWVLDTNHPAQRFYEHLGGAIVGRKEEPRDGATLVDIAYGWPDLAALTERAAPIIPPRAD